MGPQAERDCCHKVTAQQKVETHLQIGLILRSRISIAMSKRKLGGSTSRRAPPSVQKHVKKPKLDEDSSGGEQFIDDDDEDLMARAAEMMDFDDDEDSGSEEEEEDDDQGEEGSEDAASESDEKDDTIPSKAFNSKPTDGTASVKHGLGTDIHDPVSVNPKSKTSLMLNRS
jgi:TATA-binding protein-associated factor Taf7